jgi:nitroreductase
MRPRLCADFRSFCPENKERRRSAVFPVVVADCSLALGTMFRTVRALGIGSCWINQLGRSCDEPGFRAFLTQLGVPPQNQIYGCGAFGFAAGDAPKAPPRKEGRVLYVLEG